MKGKDDENAKESKVIIFHYQKHIKRATDIIGRPAECMHNISDTIMKRFQSGGGQSPQRTSGWPVKAIWSMMLLL